MKTVVISQPTFLPWIGYFRIMKEADIFVFLDSVQFERQSWQCRNRVKTANGWMWLTVPISHESNFLPIKDVEIDNSSPWTRKHWNSIKTYYGKAEYFGIYSHFFETLYKKHWTFLSELNIYIIKYLANQLGLSSTLVRSSELDVSGKRSDLVLNICKLLSADRYVSSIGAMDYMRADNAAQLFKTANIKVEFLDYASPVYPQLFGDFQPKLSFIDCLFNCGPGSPEIVFDDKLVNFHSYTYS
jgi:hypothetical protein